MSRTTESLSIGTEPALALASCTIRPAELADLDGILTIEEQSFSSPWPRSAFVGEIVGRSWSRVLVATQGDHIIGFMVYWVITSEVHLLNMAVHPTWRRHGVGRLLLDQLIATAKAEGRGEILLEVRVTNWAAQNLYHCYAFNEIAIRKGYYSDNGEDALVMLLKLDPSSETCDP